MNKKISLLLAAGFSIGIWTAVAEGIQTDYDYDRILDPSYFGCYYFFNNGKQI